MRHFLGGLGFSLELFLPRDRMKFRLGRARTKSADTNSMGLHFFREPFGEEQIESFCGGVPRNIGNGLERSGPPKDAKVAPLALNPLGQKQMRQGHYRWSIHLH